MDGCKNSFETPKAIFELGGKISNNESDIDKILMAYIHFASVLKRFDAEYLDIYFDLSRVIFSRVEDVPKPDEDSLAAEIESRQ